MSASVQEAVTQFERANSQGYTRAAMVRFVAQTCNMAEMDASAAIVAAAVNRGVADTPVQGGDLESRCRREWDASAALRAEFGNHFHVYVHYSKAVASGKLKLTSKGS